LLNRSFRKEAGTSFTVKTFTVVESGAANNAEENKQNTNPKWRIVADYCGR